MNQETQRNPKRKYDEEQSGIEKRRQDTAAAKEKEVLKMKGKEEAAKAAKTEKQSGEKSKMKEVAEMVDKVIPIGGRGWNLLRTAIKDRVGFKTLIMATGMAVEAAGEAADKVVEHVKEKIARKEEDK